MLGRFADQHDVWDALKVAGVLAIVASVGLVALRGRRARLDGTADTEDAPQTGGRAGTFDGVLRGHLLHLHHHRSRN